jgi:drug/metabolite transporter (DMT)-like permease
VKQPGDSHALLYGLIAAMVLFWSANYTIGKVALREFPPLLAGGLRIAMAGAFIAPVYFAQKGPVSWAKRDVPFLLFLGLVGIMMNQLFFVIGLSRTSVVHSSLIIGMTPIFVLLFAAAIKQERITPRKAAGMLIALGGIAILNALPAETRTPEARATVAGDLFVAMASIAFALYTVLGKKVSLRHSAVTVNTFGYVGGALALAPVILWEGRGFSFARVSLAAWSSVVYMALFSSVISYLIYYYALGRISASRVSAFNYLQPVVATLLAVIALGERVTLPVVAGGAVIFSGVYLTERG